MRTLRVLVFLLGLTATWAARGAPETRLPLAAGWSLQSSAKVPEPGEVLSTPQFRPSGWYPATVPTTVVAALVKQKVYPDPFYDMNLRQIPGTTYPIGSNFSNNPMPAGSPFAVSWWFRKTFTLPAAYRGKTVWLHLDGVNYRADVWLNGKRVATADEVAGALRIHELDVTAGVSPGNNVLAIEVHAPTETDLGITFVDWNPAPPDKNMGLWREVYLTASGPLALRHPAVISRLDPDHESARLTVVALVKNATDRPVKATVKATIERISISREVTLSAHEQRDVVFDPEQSPQLVLSKPRLWWPAQMGQPHLYPLHTEVVVDGTVSDRIETSFGIREIASQLNAAGKRVFTVNGKKILIRGGGWASDLMLRQDPQRMRDELAYVRDLGLNTVRLEGKLEPDEFFDLADREGILVMAGWCCCDHWEHWRKWRPQDHAVAEASLRTQLLRLRGHASLLAWLNGSDNPPPPDVEKMYLRVEEELRWPNPVVSSATEKKTDITGPSGVKMTGPYDYVAPSYWLTDSKNGGAHGFNTETSMGPAVPPIESLRRMLPPDHLWPIDDHWNFHAGGQEFKDISRFTEALNARYGAAGSAEEFALKSQLMAYEGVRAMFEAFSRNKYTSTGVIQWMLNNAWPSLIWHLYDHYLLPGGGYFGTKKALEPLHPVYGYDDRTVWLVNSRYEEARGLRVRARVLDLEMNEKAALEATVDAPADSSQKVLTLPELKGTPVHFLQLTVDEGGKPAGSSFYWLSSKPDVLDWNKSTWYSTPTSSYADFTALQRLPKVPVKATFQSARRGDDVTTTVTLENPGKTLAFFVRLKLTRGPRGEEILPVRWQDNYVSLLPGEKREVSATYRARDLRQAKPRLEISGWNVVPASL
jgi:exo-1,4-beta-D-glucosaminidase